MLMSNEDFEVVGLDTTGFSTQLFTSTSSNDCLAFLTKYVAHENAGNWHRIEVYDNRGVNPELIKFWETQA